VPENGEIVVYMASDNPKAAAEVTAAIANTITNMLGWASADESHQSRPLSRNRLLYRCMHSLVQN